MEDLSDQDDGPAEADEVPRVDPNIAPTVTSAVKKLKLVLDRHSDEYTNWVPPLHPPTRPLAVR